MVKNTCWYTYSCNEILAIDNKGCMQGQIQSSYRLGVSPDLAGDCLACFSAVPASDSACL